MKKTNQTWKYKLYSFSFDWFDQSNITEGNLKVNQLRCRECSGQFLSIYIITVLCYNSAQLFYVTFHSDLLCLVFGFTLGSPITWDSKFVYMVPVTSWEASMSFYIIRWGYFPVKKQKQKLRVSFIPPALDLNGCVWFYGETCTSACKHHTGSRVLSVGVGEERSRLFNNILKLLCLV